MGKKSALDSPLDINADYIGGEIVISIWGQSNEDGWADPFIVGWVSNHDMARFLDKEARALDSKYDWLCEY